MICTVRTAGYSGHVLHISAIFLLISSCKISFKIRNLVTMDNIPTTEEVNANYKTRAPKFDEKIHQGDTEDWVALSAKRKPLTVGLPPNF